jgi:hypothetical protein
MNEQYGLYVPRTAFKSSEASKGFEVTIFCMLKVGSGIHVELSESLNPKTHSKH